MNWRIAIEEQAVLSTSTSHSLALFNFSLLDQHLGTIALQVLPNSQWHNSLTTTSKYIVMLLDRGLFFFGSVQMTGRTTALSRDKSLFLQEDLNRMAPYPRWHGVPRSSSQKPVLDCSFFHCRSSILHEHSSRGIEECSHMRCMIASSRKNHLKPTFPLAFLGPSHTPTLGRHGPWRSTPFLIVFNHNILHNIPWSLAIRPAQLASNRGHDVRTKHGHGN